MATQKLGFFQLSGLPGALKAAKVLVLVAIVVGLLFIALAVAGNHLLQFRCQEAGANAVSCGFFKGLLQRFPNRDNESYFAGYLLGLYCVGLFFYGLALAGINRAKQWPLMIGVAGQMLYTLVQHGIPLISMIVGVLCIASPRARAYFRKTEAAGA
ncbi:MAG: hypothetical protein WDN72_07025 [Alphaproteobacteria bacterium]